MSAARNVRFVESAPAKVNLTLRVLGRRADGYHTLDSVVVFSALADRLALVPGATAALTVQGPYAAAAGPVESNLVLKAARALAAQVRDLKLGHFTLTKNLPAAAGIGGGSADAAAALRLLARANRLRLDDPRLRRAARRIGADVPVCLDPRSRRMRGIGEILSAPLAIPQFAAVLVNPGVTLATKDVFAALALAPGARRGATRGSRFPRNRESVLAFLHSWGNDLEPPAVALRPEIAQVLAALRDASGCRLARMSGSGATCFGLFASSRTAARAARTLAASNPRWWVRATVLG
jgi:4-diphosphocytidyl-2-C-methyl-D-erythritol kinase